MPLPTVRRLEDPRLIAGRGVYLDDLEPAGTLHMAVVRSPLAHATITEIDVSAARTMPGVVLVITPDDVADLALSPLPSPERRIPRRFALAQGVVRMVGDPVVAVVAARRAQAVEAAAAVFVDYEELPALIDPEQAVTADPLYPEFGTNVQIDRARGDPAELDTLPGPIVVTGTVEHPRLVPNSLETRGCLASWTGDNLTVYMGTQAPAVMAAEIAAGYGIAKSRVRLVTPEVGGAFGCKFDLAEEEMLTIEASRNTGRPVKWVESRREHFLAIGHGRAQRHHYMAVAGRDGRVQGLFIDSLADAGCRRRYFGGAPYTPPMGTGSYSIPVYAWRQRVVFTTKAPRGIYRGAGRPEATLTIERIMDRIAAATGIDPAEVRRRNFVTEFPFTSPGGVTYDTGDYHRALDALLEVADYDGLKAAREEARATGRLVGIGLAAYVESTAFESYERGEVQVLADGSVRVLVGTHDHGQGHRTVFAQLVARELGIAAKAVEVVQGDTAAVPFGLGTSGSRSLGQGGGAVLGAARKAASKVRRVAAHLMEAAPEDIELRDATARVAGSGDAGVSFATVAAAVHDPRKLPPGETVGLHEHDQYDSGGMTFPFGMHLATVEVDRETGEVTICGLWAVDDVGNVLNQMIVHGQRVGGMAQGIGQALYERAVYDDAGNLMTGSLMDYIIPGAEQVPSPVLAHTVTPSPHNPLGSKGVGEAGAVGTPAALANAVIDAVAPLGVEHIDVPLYPQAVWEAMQG